MWNFGSDTILAKIYILNYFGNFLWRECQNWYQKSRIFFQIEKYEKKFFFQNFLWKRKFSKRSHFLRSTFLKPYNSYFDVKHSKFYDAIGFELEVRWGGVLFNPFLTKNWFSTKIYGFSKKFFRLNWSANNSAS